MNSQLYQETLKKIDLKRASSRVWFICLTDQGDKETSP